MAFIAPLAGAAVGGGLFGSIVTGVVGLGINLAIAYFFPQKVKGPRAENLKAQTSRYGDFLARIYGTQRTAGAVIWLKGNKIDEHVRTYRAGKALGPEVTEYSYTATFAVAFVWNGPISGIPKIWADDKLIYDSGGETLEGVNFEIYLGADDQQPDPDIEADKGAGNVPAWPGVGYVVIRGLPLDEFGIRIPNIEAEVAHSGSVAHDELDLADPTSGAVFSYNDDISGDYIVKGTQAGRTIEITRISTNATVTVATDYDVDAVHITSRGEVFAWNNDDDSLRVYDLISGALKQSLPVPSGAGGQSLPASEITISGVTYAVVCKGTTITLLVNYGLAWEDPTEVGWSYDPDDFFNFDQVTIGPTYIYRAGGGGAVYRANWNVLELYPFSLATPPGATETFYAINYDTESDSVILVGNAGNLFVCTPDLTTTLRSITDGEWDDFTSLSGSLLSKRLKSGSDRIAFLAPGRDNVLEYRVSDLSLIATYDLSDWGGSATGWEYCGNSPTQRAILLANEFGGSGDRRVVFLPYATAGAASLADVIEAECNHAGVAPDVSGIAGEVKGYGVRDNTSPRGVIEDLARVNFFDFAQIDGVLTFFPRKTASARTLTVAETGMALNSEPEAVQVKEIYPAALDVPEQLILSYPSYDADYRAGAQSANPEEDDNFPDEPSEVDETGFAVKVRKKRAIEFGTNQVLTDQEAARVADLMHNDLRDASTIYRTTLGPKHLDLHPGEVIELPLDDSRVAKAVLTRMSGETLIEAEFRKRGDSYVSEAVAQSLPYFPDTLLGIADTTPVLIDGHLMRSDDDDDSFYCGVAVTSSGQYRSATIYRSANEGSTYSPFAFFRNGTIRGFAIGALPDRPHPGALDRATEFIVAVPNGTPPDSISEAELLASETSNAFAVRNRSCNDWEYIRAASVVDNGDGTWTLSTLLRGLKGTEFAMFGHTAGSLVYHLDSDAMARAETADRTLTRVYVSVATGTVFNSDNAVYFVNQGKGLRPWSPVDLIVTRDGSGNITGTFNRRDRLGQAWPESGSETPPMSEDAESYKVRVYDTDGGTLLRTITVSAETFSYSAADQTTDFGSAQSEIDFGVVQVSATYGDGIELREAA